MTEISGRVRFNVPTPQIETGRTGRARINTGTQLNATGRINVPSRSPGQTPPRATTPTNVAPAPQKHMGMIVTDKTTVAEIAQQFGDVNGKHLRLTTRPDGTRELHLHNPDKTSSTIKGKKHKAAAEFLMAVVDRETGVPGKGKEFVRRLDMTTKLVNTGKDLKDLAKGITNFNNKEALRQRTELRQQQWNESAVDKAGLVNGWTGARTAAAQRLAQPGRLAAEIAAFKDGQPGIDAQQQVSVSADGAGGVLLARSQGGGGVALKIEAGDKLKEAAFIASVGEEVAKRATSPLPFDLPKYEQVTLDGQKRDDVQDALDRLKTSPDDRTKRKADQYSQALADNGGKVGKYELVRGTLLTELPFEHRVLLVKSGQLAGDLAQAAVLTPMLGLNDHAALGGVNGKTNLNNFIFNNDKRLTAIDFEPGTFDGGLGFSDQRLMGGVKNLADHLKEAATADATSFLATVRKAAEQNDEDGTPLAGVLNSILYPNMKSGSQLFPSSAETSVISDADRDFNIKKALNGALDGLAYLRDNADAFAAAHKANPDSAVKDPDQTFGAIKQMLEGMDIDAVRTQLNATLAHVTAPPID